jgi:hypothetical protein
MGFRVLPGRWAPELRRRPPPIDPGEPVTLITEHQTPAVELLLDAPAVVLQHALRLGSVDGVQELAADSAVFSLVPVRRMGRRAFSGLIALRSLLTDQPLVDGASFPEWDGFRGFQAGGQCRAVPSVFNPFDSA